MLRDQIDDGELDISSTKESLHLDNPYQNQEVKKTQL